MYCDDATLTRALTAYQNYRPTASNHLQACRAKWIPVIIAQAAARKRACTLANAILDDKPYKRSYHRLPLDQQLGVALCLMVGWAEYLNSLKAAQSRVANTLTVRVFSFLATLDIDFQALAIRSWSSGRDGGSVPGMSLIMKFNLVRLPEFMTVYLAIHKHWQKVGSDWKRREQEEQAEATHGE